MAPTSFFSLLRMSVVCLILTDPFILLSVVWEPVSSARQEHFDNCYCGGFSTTLGRFSTWGFTFILGTPI